MNINRERIKSLFLEVKDSIRKMITEDTSNVKEAREMAKQKDYELQETLKTLNDHERVVFMSLVRQFQDYIETLNISRMSAFSHCSKLEVFDALLSIHNTDKDVDMCIEEYKKFVNPESKDEEKVDTSDIEISFESDELQKLRNSLYGYCFFIEDGNINEARKVIVKLEEQNKSNASFLSKLDRFYEKHNEELLSLNSTEKVEELLKEYAVK